jgi:hypothetical protein
MTPRFIADGIGLQAGLVETDPLGEDGTGYFEGLGAGLDSEAVMQQWIMAKIESGDFSQSAFEQRSPAPPQPPCTNGLVRMNLANPTAVA